MLVCHCRNVSDRKIRRLVKGGATSAREVARATGAGTHCGGCRSSVKQTVSEAVADEFQKSSAASSMLLEIGVPVEG